MECNSAFFIPDNPDDIPPEGGACAGVPWLVVKKDLGCGLFGPIFWGESRCDMFEQTIFFWGFGGELHNNHNKTE